MKSVKLKGSLGARREEKEKKWRMSEEVS